MGCGASSEEEEPRKPAVSKAALSGGGGVLGNAGDLLRDMPQMKMDLIVGPPATGLYLGNKFGAQDKKALHAAGVCRVVNATKEAPYHPADFEYTNVDVDDKGGESIDKYFDEVAEFVDEGLGAGGSVFIHCEMGMSRSTTLVCCYLIQKRGWSLRRSLLTAKLARPIVRVTRQFVLMLIDLEYRLMCGGALDAALLAEEGVAAGGEDAAAAAAAGESIRVLLHPSPAAVDEWVGRLGLDKARWDAEPKRMAGINPDAFAAQEAPSAEACAAAVRAAGGRARRAAAAVAKELGVEKGAPWQTPFVK